MVYLIKTTGQRDFTDFIFIIIKVNVFASLKKKSYCRVIMCCGIEIVHANLDSILLYTTVNSTVLIQREIGGSYSSVSPFICFQFLLGQFNSSC